MSRAKDDPPIAETELLFRCLEQGEWRKGIGPGGKLGVTPDAIDYEGVSVYRGPLLTPADDPQAALRCGPPRCVGVASIRPADLPAPFLNQNDTDPKRKEEEKLWEWFPVDAPSEAEGDEHAEVRARKLSDQPEEKMKKIPKGIRMDVCEALATKMTVVLTPP